MKRLILAIALLMAFPATAAAAATVDGCDVVLTAPDSSATVQLAQAGSDGWIERDVVDGIVDLRLEAGIQLAPGTWTATWEDGTQETFVVACDEPTPEPTPDVAISTTGVVEHGTLPDTSTAAIVPLDLLGFVIGLITIGAVFVLAFFAAVAWVIYRNRPR